MNPSATSFEATRLKHNRELSEDYIRRTGLTNRYPAIDQQSEIVAIDYSALPPFSYNPSCVRLLGKVWLTYRYHFAGDCRTRLGLAQIIDGVATSPRDLPIEGYSVEDARLFIHCGNMWMSWVESDFYGQPSPVSLVKYAKIEFGFEADDVKSPLRIGRVYQVKAGDNDGKHRQKNWAFFESDENLFCIYRSDLDHTVLHVQGESVVNEHKTPAIAWPYGDVRGGTLLPFDGKLIRFFHSRCGAVNYPAESRYFVGACVIEYKPPFRVLKVSRRPLLYGSELPHFDCFHFKPNVVFPCGAMTDGSNFIVACGINDSACALVKIKPEDLHL